MGVKKLPAICILAFLLLFSGAVQCSAEKSKISAEVQAEASSSSIAIKGSAAVEKGSDKKAEDSAHKKEKMNDKKVTEDDFLSSLINSARANILYIAVAIAVVVLAIMTIVSLKGKRKKAVKTIRYYDHSEEPEKGGISIGNAQHIGKREDQQDSFAISDINDSALVKQKGIFAIVADGMGGLSNGKESSNIVVSTMLDAFSSRMHTGSLPQELRESVYLANQRVNDASGLRDQQKSGSTAVAVVLKDNRLYWISVGDSRIYLFRNGIAYQITRDHVYGLELYDQALNGNISMEEAKNHPERKSLTSYIGSASIEEIDQNIKPFTLISGDRIILCSDGIYGSITEPEFIECLKHEPYQAAQDLIGRITAKDFPNQDNMTVIIVGYD